MNIRSNDNNLKNQVNEELNKLVTLTTTNTELHKKKLLDKLSDVVLNMEIDPENEKSSKIKAKVELIKVYNETIRDIEASYRENIKLQQKQSEIQDENSIDKDMLKGFLQLLIKERGKNMENSNIDKSKLDDIHISSTEQVDKELEDIVTKENIEVSEFEVKTDPKDIDVDEILDIKNKE